MIRVYVEFIDGYFFDVVGRGVSFKRGIRTQLRARKTAYGYRAYMIYNGKPREYKVHRIVATMFIPNPDNKASVNHKDGVKFNNSYKNLEWATYKENMNHAYDNGLNKNFGENNINAKLTMEDIKNIFYSSKGCRALGRELGISHTTVSSIRRKAAWRRANENNTAIL